jgi:hypothetical protein
MDDTFYQIQEFLSTFFMVPAEWFAGPQFITNLVLPYLLLAFCFYTLLSQKVRLFKGSAAVNLVLSLLLAFFSIPAFIAPLPQISLFMATWAAFVFWRGFSARNIILGLPVAVAVVVLSNIAMTMLAGLLVV